MRFASGEGSISINHFNDPPPRRGGSRALSRKRNGVSCFDGDRVGSIYSVKRQHTEQSENPQSGHHSRSLKYCLCNLSQFTLYTPPHLNHHKEIWTTNPTIHNHSFYILSTNFRMNEERQEANNGMRNKEHRMQNCTEYSVALCSLLISGCG
jgi:hypothetical protein